jgi:hypothetical protein
MTSTERWVDDCMRANARQGQHDAARGYYNPPAHCGTELSARLRRPYILAYLGAGGDRARLTRRDWYHAGVEAVRLGMPADIRKDVEAREGNR